MIDKQDNYLKSSIESGLSSENDQINFKELLDFVFRNKKFILFSGFLAFALGCIYALSLKRVWQGEFQIVLNQNQTSGLSSLRNLTSGSGPALGLLLPGITKNELKTEVAILESPSVLMNIFEYVKSEKLSRNNRKYKDASFKGWRKKSVLIGLQKGTSILNIAYKDKDKDIILPVLNKISNVYQNYTGKENRLQIDLTIEYLNDQLIIYTKKIYEAEEALMKFENKYNLSLVNVKDDKGTVLISNIEILKREVNNLDKKIALLSQTFLESDPNIQQLKRQKDALIESSKRPSGVLIKYRQLLNEVQRDRKTLLELENNLRLKNLEIGAKEITPWKLITNPTLLPKPVAPKRRNIAMITGLVGLFLGTLISKVFEEKKGIIYSVSEMKSIFQLPLLAEFCINSDNNWLETLNTMVNNISSNFLNQKIFLLTIDLDDSLVNKIENKLKTIIGSKNILFTDDLNVLNKYKKGLFIIGLGSTKKITIEEIKKRILFEKDSLIGFIALNNKLN